MSAPDLASRQCQPRTSALEAATIAALLAQVPGWQTVDGTLCKTYSFTNYYQTMAFVNALAYISHTQDHHPDLLVTYRRCGVRYQTHSVNQGQGGLSENDFICAARADALGAMAVPA